jgi:hypothetical protein
MRHARIAAVVDVRGSEEFTRRIRAIRPYVPAAMRALPDEAFP